MPTVSVIMSVYNGERYLREAIDSILNQTFRDFEFIIINDGSTDKTAEIIQSYNDERIRSYSQENIGLTSSLNKALKLAKGAYIARQDADDVSESGRLEKQIDVLDNNRSAVLVSGKLRYISATGEAHGVSNRDFAPAIVRWLLLFYNHIGGHSQVMYRQETASKLGGYNENYRYSQDYDFWLRLAEAGDIVILPEILLNWRYHGENLSIIAADEQRSFSLKTSSRYIEKYSGETVSVDEVHLLRKFWVNKDNFISKTELLEIDKLLVRILKGLKRNTIVTFLERRQIAKLVSRFFQLNKASASNESDINVYDLLAFKWWMMSWFLINRRIDAQTEKIN